MKKLLNGYQKFKENFHLDPLLKNTQTPHTMFVTCCDSRIVLPDLFDVLPGEIFVARNVANVIPPYENDKGFHGTSAALEFAVKYLKIQHLIVMGHSNCGGIQRLLNPIPQSDFISKWIESIQEAKDLSITLYNDDSSSCVEKANVILGKQRLMSFPWIKETVEKGELTVHGWYFDLETPRVQKANEKGEWREIDA